MAKKFSLFFKLMLIISIFNNSLWLILIEKVCCYTLPASLRLKAGSTSNVFPTQTEQKMVAANARICLELLSGRTFFFFL